MAESKSNEFALFINRVPKKSPKFAFCPIKGLAVISENGTGKYGRDGLAPRWSSAENLGGLTCSPHNDYLRHFGTLVAGPLPMFPRRDLPARGRADRLRIGPFGALREAIALLSAVPSALAGYHATLGLAHLRTSPCRRRVEAFAAIGPMRQDARHRRAWRSSPGPTDPLSRSAQLLCASAIRDGRTRRSSFLGWMCSAATPSTDLNTMVRRAAAVLCRFDTVGRLSVRQRFFSFARRAERLVRAD
jgi:hypothetical protein